MRVPGTIKIALGIAGTWALAMWIASGPARSEESFGVVLFLATIAPPVAVAVAALLVGGVVTMMRRARRVDDSGDSAED